jgi:hypothetical protein
LNKKQGEEVTIRRISHKEHKERKNHKEKKQGGFCLLSYREIIKLSLLTTTPFSFFAIFVSL